MLSVLPLFQRREPRPALFQAVAILSVGGVMPSMAVTISSTPHTDQPVVPAGSLEGESLLYQCVEKPPVAPPEDLLPGKPPSELPDLVCPDEEVPQPIAARGPKGWPGRLERMSGSSVRYYYAGAFQYASALGMFAKLSQHSPAVYPADYHSLGELAAQSSDWNQAVEVGWTVDPGMYGDASPHLFVFHWIDGEPTCYNGCGWTQVSAVWYPGMRLEETDTTSPAPFAIRHDDGVWWVGYQGEWIGYFPDELWEGRFSEIGLSQWFGEVASSRYLPLTNMGNGEYGDSSQSAVFDALQLLDHDGTTYYAEPSPLVSRERLYLVGDFSGTGFGFGGPGGW